MTDFIGITLLVFCGVYLLIYTIACFYSDHINKRVSKRRRRM